MSARLHACANPMACGWSNRRLSHRGVVFSLRVRPPFLVKTQLKPTLQFPSIVNKCCTTRVRGA